MTIKISRDVENRITVSFPYNPDYIAINALKFYYGGILKKKFAYEIKRPKKDKKLMVISRFGYTMLGAILIL